MEKGLLNPLDVMQQCAQLALMGKGYTKTNPCVGAIIAKENRIISSGWHEEYGKAHAEVNAIDNSPESVEGGDIYVTLEPCSHYGKTPPCAEKIVKSGIKRAFVGVVDPNPLNAGKGIDYMRANGVEVFIGFVEDLCATIIEDFAKFMSTGMPYYTIKAAQSLDGKIAASSGDSKWITSEESRKYAHYLRAVSDAVLVGANTVETDDPELTVRLIKSDRDPYKIVLDASGRIGLDRKLVRNSADKLIYVTAQQTEKTEKLKSMGAQVILEPAQNGRFDLKNLSKKFAAMNMMNILVEGGGDTIGSFFDAGLADRTEIFVAPKIIGGCRTSVGGKGVENIASAHNLMDVKTSSFGGDLLFSARATDYKTPVLELTEKIRDRCMCGREH